ncbi:hypothetical protein FML17_29495 [Klebsiella michiganensis]|uniref:hypothetical protein n=1 Tax=Klebsiella michiganensis TaxID=1134687 RepID=UPI001CCE6A9E|nr:hypothetical protein [Klebsiella michiganensis]MBZ7625926.1 hypothetical protein [Klebsiella michiganensis]
MKNAIKFLSLVTMILGADLAFADEYIDKVKSQVYSEFRDERPLSVVMSSRQDCEKGEWKSFDWDGIQKGVNWGLRANDVKNHAKEVIHCLN